MSEIQRNELSPNLFNNNMVDEAAPPSGIEIDENFVIEGDIASQISYASMQNDIPLINALKVINKGLSDIENMTLEMSCAPEIISPKKWSLDRIYANAEQAINDRNISPQYSRLANLTESMKVVLSFELKKDDVILSRAEFSVRALARNEWGGNRHSSHLLSAFIMPNDPAIERILRAASDSLKQAGKNHSIEGYQQGSRERVWEIASALWAAVTSYSLTYAEPPSGFEENGQKVRTPSHIVEHKLATCLDTVVLFSAALEQAGLNPVIIFTEGHAFCGVWLQPQNLPDTTCNDVIAIRKYVDLQDLVLFETTAVTQHPPVTFKQAIQRANLQINEKSQEKFKFAFDVKRSRAFGITPLASVIEAQNITGADKSDAVNLAVETAPHMPSFDTYIPANNNQTEAPRIESWKRKLLDLTKRNRLLNIKPSKTSVFISCGNIGLLEDELASGKLIRVRPQPEQQANRDEKLFIERNASELSEHYINDAMKRNEVIAHVSEKDLSASMTEIYRTAKNDIQEGGTNTLFLGIGILKWKQSDKEEKSYKAPLILLPISLERKSAASEIKIKKHEDEPVFNMTLLEFLRKDFDLEIPELQGELPTDHSGINVDLILNIVKKAVRDIKGFEVINETVLGIFSFAKYLMWKDLSDRSELLKQSPFVKHLIDPKESYHASAKIMSVAESDEKINVSDLYMPLEADGSQVVAVHASGSDGDFVLEGPPGTGKSQTIANMIAHNLAMGKRVLFVSEKMAALEVVYRRLVDKGLGRFCLELHSNKANKKEILSQLEAAWRNDSTTISLERQQAATTLEKIKKDLNALVAELHKRHPSGFSFRHAVGRAAKYGHIHSYRLNESDFPKHDLIETPEDYIQIMEFLEQVSATYQDMGEDTIEALQHIQIKEWSNEGQQNILEAIGSIKKDYEHYKSCLEKLNGKMKLIACKPITLDAIRRMGNLFECILQSAYDNISFIFSEYESEAIKNLQNLLNIAETYQDTYKKLSVAYPYEKINSSYNNIDTLVQKYQGCKDSFLPLGRFFLKRKLKHSYNPAGNPELSDILTLAELSKLYNTYEKGNKTYIPNNQTEIHTLSPLSIKAIIERVKKIKSHVNYLKSELGEEINLSSAIKKLFTEDQEMINPEGALYQIILNFIESSNSFQNTIKNYLSITGLSINGTEDCIDFIKNAENILLYKNKIRTYIRRNSIKQEAEDMGLGSIITALENSIVSSTNITEQFITAYTCYLAPKLQDRSKILREFCGLSHEDKIKKFCNIDKDMQCLSAEYIIAKLTGNIPSFDEPSLPQGYSILRRELQKKQRHKPIRQLISEMGSGFTTLAPCVLMSPISVAQFLEAGETLFDIVIFDEASQITVWDAVGAIARAKKSVIVGDPKQMPPTSFFGRVDTEEEEDNQKQSDLESILDEALASGLKLHRLTGHYRSKHESLITFSNHRYYNGELVTYPANDTRDSGVSFKKCHGIYKRGKGQVNTDEAKEVVAEVIRRLNDPVLSELSIGIVTMNSHQQKLIEDLLDDERRKNPVLEEFFSDSVKEPVFVKNLENVQGDQRDIILISVGYGPDTPGAKTMSMNFGPLNRVGGERRLNVAITRATTETVIFASFDPDMIDLTRTKSEAIRDLKHYLEFAKGGVEALGSAVHSVGGINQYDSEFEEAVANALRKKGFVVHTQIGISKFRIDLGVVHPEIPGKYIAGIECDGATYHSSPSAKDRDRVRQAILENKGWNLIRIWSTDYFNDPETVIDKVVNELNQLLF